MQPWPDDYFLRGNFAPWPMEGDIADLVIAGEIPRTLRGALYRIGPNPQYPPRGVYDWFSGDGMVHAFHIENGRVRYRNRWVRTPKFQRERAAQRALIGGLRSLADSEPDALASLAEGSPDLHSGLLTAFNAANTNLLAYDGHLLALVESSLPTALDSRELATVGGYDFHGALAGSMTAHPRLDPETGELIFFSYGPMPPYLRYYAATPDGVIRHAIDVPIQTPVMVHDFAVTAHHAVFFASPATFRAENLLSGMPVRWEPDLGTQVAIVRRDDPAAQPRWFALEPGYVFHFSNAWTDGEQVIVDGARYDRLPLLDIPGPFDGIDTSPARLTRWTFHLTTGVATERRLDDLSIEFPRVDERRSGQSYRHVYAAGRVAPAGDAGFYNAIVRYDLASEARATLRLGPDRFTSEPVFVPLGPAEGDGVVLAVVYRAHDRRSELLVLDAKDVGGPPLAIAEMPHRVPFGFHGIWLPCR